jgi:hypothetical protein
MHVRNQLVCNAKILAFMLTVSSIGVADSLGIPDKAAQFECSLAASDGEATLTIRISTPHAQELGVWGPDNEFYFLTACEPDLRAESLKTLECAAFTKLKQLTLDVATLKAPTAGSGYKDVETVFRKNGRYTFMLAKNLETENTSATVNKCRVSYARPRS